jgi:plastocyanin
MLRAAAPVLATLLAASAALARQPAAGRIEGRITFEGRPPAPLEVAESGGDQKVLHVDRSGGLRYAVMYLPDATPSPAPPAGEAVMDQRRFVFEPQVLAIRAGQAVRFTNSDPANHNVRSTDANPANAFSVLTADARTSHTHRFAATPPDRPVVLTCDIHPWMAAWVYAFTHDRFAVSGPDGRFTMAHVPAGRHRIAIRQPAGRLARDLAVDVRAGETTRLDVRFTTADVGMPSR